MRPLLQRGPLPDNPDVLRRWLACAMAVLAGCSAPDRLERRGNFEIAYYRTDAFGHIATRQALHHLKGSRRTQVVESASELLVAPNDPDRAIYRTCDSAPSAGDEATACAHMFYDGHTGQSHVIGRGLEISMSQLEMSRWSPNGDYLVLGDQFELVLLDLRVGRTTHLAEILRLEEPFYPERWQHRYARFGGWSPDGTSAAVFVLSPRAPGVPLIEWNEELHSIDGSTGTVTLVATHAGTLGAPPGRGLWRAGNLKWNSGELLPPP